MLLELEVHLQGRGPASPRRSIGRQPRARTARRCPGETRKGSRTAPVARRLRRPRVSCRHPDTSPRQTWVPAGQAARASSRLAPGKAMSPRARGAACRTLVLVNFCSFRTAFSRSHTCGTYILNQPYRASLPETVSSRLWCGEHSPCTPP